MKKSELRARVAAIPVAVLGLAGALGVSGAAAQGTELEAVVVTATRTPVPPDQLAAQVVVIDRTAIEQAQGATLAGLLQRAAGVQISSSGGLGKASTVFIRGTEGRHVLLLIDGVRYGSATLGTPNWDNLPLAAIERIEVLKGPAAALYGSDAVGGVVQIFTRRGQEGFHPHAELGLGAYGRRSVALGVAGGQGGLSYRFGVSSLRESGFSATNPAVPFGLHHPDADGFEQDALDASVRLALAPGWALSANGLLASGDNAFDSGSGAFAVRGLTTTRVLGLGLERTWAAGARTQLRLNRADDLTRNFMSATNASHIDTRRRQWTLQHDQPTGLGTLTLGAEHTREQVNSSVAYTVRERRIEGVFVGLQGSAGPHAWQASARQDDNSQFGSASTGSLAYAFEFAEGWRMRAAHGTSFKVPSFNQLYWPGFGNPSTQPERGRSSEIGLSYEFGQQSLQLTRFEQRIRGFITAAPTVANVPRVQIDGWNLVWQGSADDWRWRTDLELLEARNRTPGANFDRQLPRRAEQQLALSVERAWGDAWWLGAHALLVGERFDDAANTQRLPGYGKLDLSAEHQLSSDWRLQLRLNNVGDKRYETALGFNQPGRALFASLTWQPQR
ncbi:outer membrane cobalamin receptor protein [Serpentinimonas raichei]|uniref:Outer membrane cobalamin receptor protein n=1 Tax=Serpentinimonas raichei TaxID=1458425 RepID=A0A060NGY0_9BURK|nr:TonB-dependent receptor [Serpentinimonas sp.]BAO80277.1 outer membrane cobalamin receptor protein [Serpentinimonas raichei]